MQDDVEDTEDDWNPNIGDVVDPATGLPRLLESKCTTCIRRPDTSPVFPERRDEVEQAANERGSWVVCHNTLPSAGVPIGQQAICRGYWDVNKTNSLGCRLAVLFGGPVEVPHPPSSY